VQAVVAPAAAEAQISGNVVLAGARGQQIVVGEQADTLVYFVPKAGSAPAKPGQYTVYTHNRDFSPEAIAVPEGSKVTFVNLDDVRHNVFSVTPGSSFDLGYQGAGEKASHVFERPGVVLVSCHVHRAMELDMLVVPTPYVGKVAADGSFELRGLPAGPGTLHLWNPRARPVSEAVTLPLAGTLTLKMLATRPRMTTQLNTGGAP
jgi:plastocyanin